MEQKIKQKFEAVANDTSIIHTTIAIQKGTKKKLDKNRAPGQCYDGFINELVAYWERYRIGSSLCGPGRPIHQKGEERL